MFHRKTIAPKQSVAMAKKAPITFELSVAMVIGCIRDPAAAEVAAGEVEPEVAEETAEPEEFAPVEGKFGRFPDGIGELPVISAVLRSLAEAKDGSTVILPRIELGKPELVPETADAPSDGNAAFALTVHARSPVPAVGHAGAVVLTVAAYALESTPVGLRVAHCCLRLLKSGATGVGVP